MNVPQAKEMLDLGVYFHVPFCPKICDFCAFYQLQVMRIQIRVSKLEIYHIWPELKIFF